MSNHILEELWEVRRGIEGKGQDNLKKLIAKFKKKQMKSPSKYYRGKSPQILRQKTK